MEIFISESAAAAESIESRLRNIWTELLEVTADQVTTDSNFFTLGGNSMLVLSLHVSISAEFNISATLAELLEHADFGSMMLLTCNTMVSHE